jgi:hypothetical protein
MTLLTSSAVSLLAKGGIGGLAFGAPARMVLRTWSAPSLSTTPISEGTIGGRPGAVGLVAHRAVAIVDLRSRRRVMGRIFGACGPCGWCSLFDHVAGEDGVRAVSRYDAAVRREGSGMLRALAAAGKCGCSGGQSHEKQGPERAPALLVKAHHHAESTRSSWA